MPLLADLIAQSVDRWDGPFLETDVFGTTDATAISERLGAFCSAALGSPAAEGLFYKASVACVAGIRLVCGRTIVVKCYQARWTEDFLAGVVEVQFHLAQMGFPCPSPLVGPTRLGTSWATVETFMRDPGQDDLVSRMMATSAGGLADQIRLCREIDSAPLTRHPLAAPRGRLYPEPHSPLFDFEATASGAGWIDQLAVAGKETRDAESVEPVVAHTDWSARNVRMSSDRLLAVYDWDSLAAVPETTAVGQAAATWSSLGEAGEPVAPSVVEVSEYVHHYEEARGVPFAPRQYRAIGGAALWVLAYTARCEHALDPGGAFPGRARPRLASEGEEFLRLEAGRDREER